MTSRPVVVDMNHEDAFVNGKDVADFKAAYKFGIRGIVHKAAEGVHFVDPLYHVRKQRALDAGMLWGAYFFMRPGDVGAQVSKFLEVVGVSPKTDTRMVLDYEDPKLSLWQAERWLALVHAATGQTPWLYSGFLVREQTDRRDPGPALSQYPLWLAEYSTVERIPRPWKTSVLWQYSETGVVPGIGHREDLDSFDGTDDQLKAAWLDSPASATEAVA